MSWRKKCRRHTTASESSTRHTGRQRRSAEPCFSDVFGQDADGARAGQNPRVCAITAAMRDGTGLKTFARKPSPSGILMSALPRSMRLSMACGMAKQGLIPVSRDLLNIFAALRMTCCCTIWRLQQLHVVLGVDRAGLVGADGRTHHGMFDVGYLRTGAGHENLLSGQALRELSPHAPAGGARGQGTGRCALSERRRGKLYRRVQGAVAFKRGQRLHCDHLWYDNQRRSRSGGRLRKRGNFRRGFEACDDCTAGFCSDRGILPARPGGCWWSKKHPITAALPTSFLRACCKAVSWDTSASRISETATSATARCRIYMRWRG